MSAEAQSRMQGERDLRERLRAAIDHLDHILPGQAPLKDFVHHNTLHGYEADTFPDALAKSRQRSGNRGYLPENEFRALYAKGRITREDLIPILDADPDLDASGIAVTTEGEGARCLTKREVYLLGLTHPFQPMTGPQLAWHIEEMGILEQVQEDVPEESRRLLLEGRDETDHEAEVVGDLWRACLESLGLEHFILHPEELLDLSTDRAEEIIKAFAASSEREEGSTFSVRDQMKREAGVLLRRLLKRVGRDITLRGVFLALTGEDLLDDIRPLLVRQMANHLDLGVAALHSPDRREGFFTSWKRSAEQDLAWAFEEMPDWRDEIDNVPSEALEAIIHELQRLGLSKDHWADYLENLALDLPGWSGMIAWRRQHPGYLGLPDLDMADYLAVRLILERLFARRLCIRTWNIAPDLNFIHYHFRNNQAEFLVRYALFNLRLPEYAAQRAHRLVTMADGHPPTLEEWDFTAHMIWTWRHSPNAEKPKRRSAYHSGWLLFRLAQHLGWNGDAVRNLPLEEVEKLLRCLARLTPDKAGFLWLQAYENNYRDKLFTAVVQNHGRGRWRTREKRPAAQVVFCMDDREEGIRRHLEEKNPAIETFGAAGFFGVPINWTALDDDAPTPLCPVVVTPSHAVREVARPGTDAVKAKHNARRAQRLGLVNLLWNETRRRLLGGAVTAILAAPFALVTLVGKIFAPLAFGMKKAEAQRGFEPAVPTDLALTAASDEGEATPENNREGFTTGEQADKVQGFLKIIGLLEGFAPLMVIMGHGSISENNPFLAAYDCGACSGRHGGPNARVFAAMANRPEVRDLLRPRGIDIPDDTWFLGAFHNTGDESFDWYDLDRMPARHQQALAALQADLDHASRLSAHERCRKFESAPENPGIDRALDHVVTRSLDISQVQPEFGHATNAAAFIGRRALSQGAFFDRRAFLISYDPSTDPEGLVVENILLNAGPVGAGINLEYYFSTVNNDGYGCGSKTIHNVSGFFGVMAGTESDLLTGLPRQMIQIHEAMRLQVLVEASTEILTTIYMRQPALQELVGNGWLLLAAKDPDGPDIQLFKPDVGWVPWEAPTDPLPLVDDSPSWYRGHRDHLPPALIRQPEEAAHG